jgi:hypothetical protein
MSRLANNAALAAAAVMAVSPAGTAAAKPAARADLVISAISVPPGAVPAGATLSVVVGTRNAGRRAAKRSSSAVYLSPDAHRDRTDPRVGVVQVARLRPHQTRRLTVHVVVPATTKPGPYRLLVCADAAAALREVSERNNCRVAPGTLVVQAAGTTPPPVADDDGDGVVNSADCAPEDPTIYPGNVDRPDVPAFKDSNCDGIDGDAAHAIFVSPTGNDSAPGTKAEPKLTLHAAVAAAGQGGDVYVRAGTYAERLDDPDGVNVYGGYNADWSRSLSAVTKITGAPLSRTPPTRPRCSY